MICTFLSLSADAWAAIAQWVTVGIAGAAALFAYRQVGEARKTREEVAQPNVVVFPDINPTQFHYLDLVIKNFGQTPAYNITLDIEPLEHAPYDSAITGKKVTSLYVPPEIVVLAPGQEWRTVWESGTRRSDYETVQKLHSQLEMSELKSVFSGTVNYQDRDGKKFTNPIRLDINTFRSSMRIKAKD
ncbi:hypothetical protein [Mycobacterium sp. pW045]|uniref:hypothetical protein n=1 Tax=Mycobacterium sp. pW045 TaxID=3238984 RepID=UPI00351BA354